MVTRQQITTALAGRSPADLWEALVGHARTLQPFWTGAVEVFAARTSLPDEKRDRHFAVIGSAFDKMDQWRRVAVNALMAEVERIWETFRAPSPLAFSDAYWSAKGGDADVELRSAAIAAFHSGS
jgi:hypothetical protein